MNKFLLVLGMFVSLLSMSAYADQTHADVNGRNKGNVKTERERTPALLPTVDIVYDSDAHTVEIVCSVKCDACVYVYDGSGSLVDYASSMDETLFVCGFGNSVFHVLVEANNWYATAEIIM